MILPMTIRDIALDRIVKYYSCCLQKLIYMSGFQSRYARLPLPHGVILVHTIRVAQVLQS